MKLVANTGFPNLHWTCSLSPPIHEYSSLQEGLLHQANQAHGELGGATEMGEIPVSPMHTVDYEAWVQQRQSQRKPSTITNELFPLEKIQEVKKPRLPDGTEEELALLGGPAEEVDQELASAAERKGRRDKKICSCGHSEGAHSNVANMVVCQPARQYCKCNTFIPVLRPDDARFFMHTSEGSGPLHALTKGIRRMQLQGVKAELLVPKACFRCEKPTPRLIPLMLSSEGTPTHSVGRQTILVCESCFDDSGLSILYEPLR